VWGAVVDRVCLCRNSFPDYLYCFVASWVLGHQGKQQSEDEVTEAVSYQKSQRSSQKDEAGWYGL
jgi:hypothetical protein